MHATVQPSGRCPKPMNGPTSTSQLKPSSECTASFPSQVKGKKREPVDQGFEPRRSSKMDDGDSSHARTESFWKSEIAKFTDKGGLVDPEGVEKLVQLMLPDGTDKKIDLVGRSIVAGVIASTDKFDCLNRFVQLRGLPVFDEWLQEVHKGKIGEGSSLKDNDKPVEEFLLVLLRALDKLPVNLHALQMCYIGKSVNHLRAHKNLEIQKKARSLVDTWKKRVEAEMDAKCGSNQAVSWAARQRLPEVSHGGSRHSGATSEIAMKSSAVQLSASKSAPVKLVQGEPKLVSTPPGSLKSVPSLVSSGNYLKEGQACNTAVGSVCDTPLPTAGDDKSSSSSQSHNNSQSCSGDHAKTGGYSGKEDARSSTAVSMTTNKVIGGSSWHHKSINGFTGPTFPSTQKETVSSRNLSMHRNLNAEKLPESSLTYEKVVDLPTAEGNNHKLIVKLSNRGRSPARSASGGSFEDPSIITSRGSSPLQHDQFHRNLKEKSDAYRVSLLSDVNAESWQSNDFKEMLIGSDEGDRSPATLPCEDNSRTGDDMRKLVEVSKAASSSSGIDCKSVKLQDASYSSMNALIESCVKYSEPNISSISGADDVGINLLASVATGEMAKLEMASPAASPQSKAAIGEHSCISNDLRMKSSPGGNVVPDRAQPVDDKRSISPINLPAKNTEDKSVVSMTELDGHMNSSRVDVQKISEPCMESNTEDKSTCGKEDKSCNMSNEGVKSVPKEVSNSFVHEDKVKVPGEVGTETDVGSYHIEIGNENVKSRSTGFNALHSKGTEGISGELLHCFDSCNDVIAEHVDVVKADEADCGSQPLKKQKTEEGNIGSVVSEHKGNCVESIEGREQIADEPISPPKLSSTMQDPEQQARSGGVRLTAVEADETEECTSAVMDVAPSSAGDSNKEAKVEFDLNEGFNSDDGRFGELNSLRAPENSSLVQLLSPLSLPVSSGSSGLPASVTVASAAKSPFVPPEDLLKNKVELGWKGSAATSAFRPAEPRKSQDLPLTISNSFPDVPAAKASRLPLDIDLNVADERIQEDIAFPNTIQGIGSAWDLANNHDLSHVASMGSAPVRNSGGLDLDLNRVGEPTDIVTSNGHILDPHLQPVKSPLGGVHTREVRIYRDFDLNDGPLVDEAGVEQSSFGQHTRNGAPSHAQPFLSTLRINNAEIGKFSSRFTQGNPYSAVAMQSALPDRGEQPFPVVAPGEPQRMLAASATSTPFTPDVYKGPVLSSSPAVPFPSAPFQYPVFSFGNFPLHSTTFSGGSNTYVDSPSAGRICFPTMHSQVLGPAGAVQSHYNTPFIIGLPDNNNGGAESSRKWGRQGLDLNTGPLGPGIEGRDETSSIASRQLSVANSLAISEEQSRIYQVAGGGALKRKGPDGGWEGGYKQASWQ